MADLIGSLEQDALTGLFNFWTGRVAEDLSKIINKGVNIGTGVAKTVQPAILKEQYPGPRLIGTIQIEGLDPFYVLMTANDAAMMVDLFMGGDGTGVQTELNEMQMNILEEMTNQIGAALSASLSRVMGKTFKCLPPKVQVNGMTALPQQLFSVTYQIRVRDLLTGPFVIFIGMHHAMELGTTLLNLKPAEAGGAQGQQALSETVSARASVSSRSEGASQQGGGSAANAAGRARVEEREVVAKPAQLQQLHPQSPIQKVGNLDLIFDVLLQLTAVLGRTGITIKDLVELGPGSVLELDKLVGEAVELYANNKLVAKGEVVVIDERFAIRVTETVAPAERLQGLNLK